MAEEPFREVTDPKLLAFYDETLKRLDLKELLYSWGLRICVDEFFEPIKVRLVSIVEIEYIPSERQLTA